MAWATCAKASVFRHNWGFLALRYADGKYHQHGSGRLYFLFVRIISVFWDPMVGTYVDKQTSKAGNIVASCYRAGGAAGDPVGITVRPVRGLKGSVAFAFVISSGAGPGLFAQSIFP